MQTYPPGTRIGQYEIASRPMMGGMGVVYFALDHGNDGRPVALKTFRPELLPDRAARDRFLREGTAWVELGSHPHIVRCYKVEYIDPTAFLVLELIAKEQNMPDASLRSWLIPGRPLPLEQALLFALQIARGMQFATEKIPGFVHRDLKPENILVGADRLPNTNINRLRITDFGLVKTIADSSPLSTIANDTELKPIQVQFTKGAGTPLYMAPEQWNGEPVGVYTDVYAFGCIMYEILSGQSAAEGKTITELQNSHSTGRLRPLPQNNPENLTEMVMKCLELNSDYRYRYWGEVSEVLERFYTQYSGHSAPRIDQSTDPSRDDQIQAGRSYVEIGLAFTDLGKASMAIQYFERALDIGKAEKDDKSIGVALSNIGMAYVILGDSRRAIEYQKQSLEILREIKERSLEGISLGRLGVAYKNLGDPQHAIQYHQQALSIHQEMAEWRNVAVALCDYNDETHVPNSLVCRAQEKRHVSRTEWQVRRSRNADRSSGQGQAAPTFSGVQAAHSS